MIFHSLFYRILTPTSTNFLDFGNLLLNSPTIRTFTIDNISKKRLLLEITSSLPEEIKIYTKATTTGAASFSNNIQRREKLIESISDKRKLSRPSDGPIGVNVNSIPTQPSPSSRPESLVLDISPDYLDLASSTSATPTDAKKSSPKRPKAISSASHKSARGSFKDRSVLDGAMLQSPMSSGNIVSLDSSAMDEPESLNSSIHARRKKHPTSSILNSLRHAVAKNNLALVEMLEAGGQSPEVLIALLEVFTGVYPPILSSSVAEERYIRAQLLLKRELNNLIVTKSILPISMADIAAESELVVILVFTPIASNKLYIQV